MDRRNPRRVCSHHRGDCVPSLMLDVRLRIANSKEAEDFLPDLRAKIMASGLSDREKTFLLEAVTSTVDVWRHQMSQPYTTAMKADKKFEGQGYRVVLSARPPNAGVLNAIKRMLGRG